MMEARMLHAARVETAEKNAQLMGQTIPGMDQIAGIKDPKVRALRERERERRLGAMDPEIAGLHAAVKVLEKAAVMFAQGKVPVAVTVQAPSAPGSRAMTAAGDPAQIARQVMSEFRKFGTSAARSLSGASAEMHKNGSAVGEGALDALGIK